MIDRKFLLFGLLGVAIVAALWGSGIFISRGAHVVLEGKIQKVRVQALDETNTAVLVDFRFTNPADYPLVVREAEIEIETADGKTVTGRTVADVDAGRFIAAYPELGGTYNQSLMTKEKIVPKQTADRMIAASFELKASDVEKRKKIRVRVTDVDGPQSVIE